MMVALPTTGRRLVLLLAMLSLVLAYAAGLTARAREDVAVVQGHFPGMKVARVAAEKPCYEVVDPATGARQMLVVVETAQGWGGPLQVGVVIDGAGVVREVLVLAHKETPSFFLLLDQNGFFRQFAGRPVDAALRIGADIDVLSSATISSTGFTKAARLAAHSAAREFFARPVPEEHTVWQIGYAESLLVVLYAVILVCLVKRYQRVRLVVLTLSILLVGLYANRTLSIANIGSLLLGYLPPPREQLFWWLLVVGGLALTLLLGKNFYCSWVCPFGGIQELVARVSGLNIKISAAVETLLRGTVLVLLWFALMVMFLTRNPALGNFEPFATLFSLHGLEMQWYLVTVSLAGAVLIPRFWCRFFCPVGGFFKQVVLLRKRLVANCTRAVLPPGPRAEAFHETAAEVAYPAEQDAASSTRSDLVAVGLVVATLALVAWYFSLVLA